jgi:hypothetical protein
MKNTLSIIIITLIISNITSELLKIPFKSKEKKKLTEENLMSQLTENEIYIDAKIGTPNQNIQLYIKLNEYPTFITSSSHPKNIPKFDNKKSSTFNFKEHYDIEYKVYDFTKGKLSEDTFILIDSKKKNYEMKNFNFYLATELKEGKEEMSGEIGFKLIEEYGEEKANFLNNLKLKNLTENYIFSIQYNDDNNGILYLGNYYHQFDKNYKESDFKIMKVGIPKSQIQWQLYFDKINIKNESLLLSNAVDLSYEFGLILSNLNYYEKINELYFNNYKNECEEIKFNNDIYFYIKCSDKINIKQFPELNFINNELNYTIKFNGEELFYKFKGNYYFQIIFKTEHTKNWKFGKIFFKKYQIFFNRDKKIIGLYPYIKKSLNFSFSWILVIILIFIIIGILIYVKKYYTYKKRKIRANELIEEFDYEPQNNGSNIGKETLLRN